MRKIFVPLAMFFFFAGQSHAKPYYQVTDLGALPGSLYSEAFGLNNAGQVVGVSDAAGVLFSGGTVTNLGSLYSGDQVQVFSINNAGQAVGLEYMGYNPILYALLFQNGKVTYLGTVPGGSGSLAQSINDSGVVVGGVLYGGGAFNATQHAALFANGTVIDLGTLPGGGFSRALGINDAGEIVGTATDSTGANHIVLFSGGQVIDLGTSFSLTGIDPINNVGQIVGSDGTQAAIYYNGTVTELGLLPGFTSSTAYGINDSGDAVGTSSLFFYIAPGVPGGITDPVLFHNGQILNLNDVIGPSDFAYLNSAIAINDAGQIVGIGTLPNGDNRAYLLTPAQPPSVPEPGTLALVGIGIVAILGRKRPAKLTIGFFPFNL